MSRRLQTFIVITGVFVVLGGLWVVDNFIYPLKAEQPNFSDVEKAFAKLTFPSDWVEVSSSENRGMFGRGCDMFNDSGCFHKSKTFKVNDPEDPKIIIKNLFLSNGCVGILENATYEGNSNSSPKTFVEMSCQLNGGVTYSASISHQKGEISVVSSTD